MRLSTGNPGKNGAPAIVKYLDNPIDGVVTLITMPAPDWTVTKEAWWGALQRKATVVDCSPVERAQLPAWLKARLARHELVMSPETLDYFADMMEGNLFAAAQEIEKLSLLHPKGEITSEQLRQVVSSNARFDFDTLFESMRLGQADRIVRIIDGLEAQAEALPFLLAMLTAEIRSLIKLRTGYDNGQSRVTGRPPPHREEALRRPLRLRRHRQARQGAFRSQAGLRSLDRAQERRPLSRLLKPAPREEAFAHPQVLQRSKRCRRSG